MPKKGKKGAKGGAVEAETGLKDTSVETQPELDVISPEEHDAGALPKAEPSEAPAATPEGTSVAATYSAQETLNEASERPKALEPAEDLLTPPQQQQQSTPEQREPAPETESSTTEQQQQTEVKAVELVAPTPAPVVPVVPAAVRQASLQHEEGEKKPEVPPRAPETKVGKEERTASIPTQRPSQEQPPAKAPPAVQPEQKPETRPAVEHGVTPALPKAPEHTPSAQAPVSNNNAAAAGHSATPDRLEVAVKGVKVVKGQKTIFFVIPVSDDHLEFTIEVQLPGPGGKTLTKTTRYNDVFSLHNAMRSTHFMTKETAALFPPKGRHSMSPNDPFIKSRNASLVSYFQALFSQHEALKDPAMRLFFKV